MKPSKDIHDAAEKAGSDTYPMRIPPEYYESSRSRGYAEMRLTVFKEGFIAGATHPCSNPDLQEKYRQVVEERDRLKAEAEKMTELIALLITLSPNKDKYVEALAGNSKQQP
jgi:hypothetical protein